MYPLLFTPILKEKLWGGDALFQHFSVAPNTQQTIGETFLISGLPNDTSTVANGYLKGQSLNKLIQEFQGQLVGTRVFQKHVHTFPLLIKIIDAKQALSVQVHPNDDVAKQFNARNGKTEMWYVLKTSSPEARFIAGFDQPCDNEHFRAALNNGNLLDTLHTENVSPGDTFYINAGKVHSIGAGCMLAEIQQTSDLTYRIYDFDRLDAQGNKRELHLDEAQKAIDFSDTQSGKVMYQPSEKEPVQLVDSAYFKTTLLNVNSATERDYRDIDSFVILLATEGYCNITANHYTTTLNKWHAALIPAISKRVFIHPNNSACKLLEIHL